MSDIWILLIFTIIRFFALFFNFLLFSILSCFADKTRLPTVYIYNMLLGNTGEIITGWIIHLMPMVLSDEEYFDFRNSSGALITLSSTFSYEHPIYLTFLMIFQRIFCVFSQNNKIFSDTMVWVYCSGIMIFSLVSLLIPYFSNCRINANQRTSSFEAQCAPDRHWITLLQNKYLILIPIISMVLNICLIIHLSFKKRDLERSIRNRNRIGVIRSNHASSHNRDNFEKTLLFQSVSTTTFLLIYELSGVVIRNIPNYTDLFSAETRRLIFYTRTTSASLLCFLVYFIGTPSTRKLLINRLFLIWKGVTSAINSTQGSVGNAVSSGVIT